MMRAKVKAGTHAHVHGSFVADKEWMAAGRLA
jgi:hypothetical protein